MTQGDAEPDSPVGHQSVHAERSGADVVEALETAADGTQHGGVQTDPADMKPHAAPVEQARGDEAMTQGQLVDGPGIGKTTPENPSPAAAGSGGAQSIVGGRGSDRISAGEQPPTGPPFDDEDPA